MEHFIVYMMFSHWIGDFSFQTNWQAQNKSINNYALFSHVIVYAAVMTLNYSLFKSGHTATFFTITFCSHFITDYFTSRVISHLWKKNRVHDFFVIIGLDQFIHFCTIYGTLKILN